MAGVERGSESVVRIDGIAAGGAGVGRLPSGQAVFVHRTAPDETVRVRVIEGRKRWARADLVELVEASPARRSAPCPHYDRCGGCTLEHMRYDAQLRAKAEIVREALRRIGGIDVDAPEVVASPREFQYRNRVSFTLRRLRDGRVVAGFHQLGHPDRIIDIGDACLQPDEEIADAWHALRAEWGPGARHLPAGPELRLTLRVNELRDIGLVIEGGTGRGDPGHLMSRVPNLVGIWHRADHGSPIVTLAGADSMPERWQEFEFELAPASFLQVNRDAARLLEDHVMERAGDVRDATVVDAYCGVGFHAQRLAAAGATVVGIELDASAVEQGRILAAQRGLDHAAFIAGDVGAELPAVLPADLVILNPPRAGVGVEVTDALAARPPKRLIYVSCDPATLARDAQRLAPVLRLERVRCFDLFPQTSHVETVAEFAA